MEKITMKFSATHSVIESFMNDTSMSFTTFNAADIITEGKLFYPVDGVYMVDGIEVSIEDGEFFTNCDCGTEVCRHTFAVSIYEQYNL